ncbi:alpha/beta hydrolase [Nemorincola caseinilytica]|uniref:Alpha/beta hydrolase n=1 Tax=Nemorincola caseinilytica TaxID=2054315 RepID=A0ABP8N569_9BACT
MLSDPLVKNNVTVVNNDSKGRTIIFAHGFGTDQNAWKEVSTAFANDHRMVLYDNVGAGKAQPEAFSPNRYDSLHSYADDLVEICAALDVKDAIMVGHSVSGMISLLAAIKQPDLFSEMILVGASPRYLNDDGYVGGFDQPSLNGLYDAMANNYYAWVSGFAPAAMANPDRPELAMGFAETLSAIRPDIAQSVARVIFQSDHRADLHKLNKRTLLLQTKHDIAVPMQVAEYLARNIGNSTMHVVDAEGHFPHISAAKEIIREIRNFI